MRTDVDVATCPTVTGSIARRQLGQCNKMKRRHHIDLVKFVPHRRVGRGKVAVRNDYADTGVIDQYIELYPRGDSLVDKPDPLSLDSKISLNSLLHFGSHSASRLRRISRMEHCCISCPA